MTSRSLSAIAMRERLAPHPDPSSRREQWRHVARPRDRVVFDAADTGDILGDDAECPSFLLRSDGPPEVHDTLRDHDILLGRVRPFLSAQFSEQSVTDQAVAFFIGARGSAAGQHLQQVGAADDADDLAVMYDWDPLDPLGFHQLGNLAQAGQLPYTGDLSGHDVL